MRYDAVVVGAGPAGCAAAYDLCRAGRSVLLIDRRTFPRVKPCAGGLTMKTLRALRFPVDPVVREVCTSVVVGKGYVERRRLESGRPLVAMTVRTEFDHYCLEMATEAGTTFRVVRRIEAIREDDDGVTLVTTAGRFRAAFVVGADGANSRVRRLVAGLTDVQRGFAIEADVRPRLGRKPSLRFDFGVVPSGYGWVFPKGDHVNVGLYTGSPDVRISRDDVAEYAGRRLGTDALENLVGHHIGLDGWDRPRRTRRVLLVGDAAGLVDALLGEGIYAAVRSGQAAAAAIDASLSDGRPAPIVFDRAVRPLLGDARRARRLAEWCYRHEAWAYRIGTLPLVRHGVLKGYARGLSMTDITNRLPLLAVLPNPRRR